MHQLFWQSSITVQVTCQELHEQQQSRGKASEQIVHDLSAQLVS